MNILTLIIASLALLLSLVALYLSFFIYRRHDRELQYQSDILKKYDIDNTEEEIAVISSNENITVVNRACEILETANTIALFVEVYIGASSC